MKSFNATTTITTTTLVSLTSRKDIKLEKDVEENSIVAFQQLENDLSTYVISNAAQRNLVNMDKLLAYPVSNYYPDFKFKAACLKPEKIDFNYFTDSMINLYLKNHSFIKERNFRKIKPSF